MFAEKLTVTLVTAADGSCTAYSDTIPYGRVLAILVGAGLANGYGITITVDGTGEAVETLSTITGASKTYPRVPVHTEAGAGALFAAGGTALREPVTVVKDRLKFVVASGGNVATAVVTLIIG